MDIAAQFGLGYDYKPRVKLTSKKESAVLHMFGNLPPTIVTALYAVGQAAQKRDSVKNELLALAELTNEMSDTRLGFHPGYFSCNLTMPREARTNWRLLGGSLGDLVGNLTDPDEAD